MRRAGTEPVRLASHENRNDFPWNVASGTWMIIAPSDLGKFTSPRNSAGFNSMATSCTVGGNKKKFEAGVPFLLSFYISS